MEREDNTWWQRIKRLAWIVLRCDGFLAMGLRELGGDNCEIIISVENLTTKELAQMIMSNDKTMELARDVQRCIEELQAAAGDEQP